MKKIVSAIVLAVMLLALMASAVFAANGSTLRITGTSVTVKAGEMAKITLTVEENPGFMGIVFYPVIKDQNNTQLNWSWTADMDNTDLCNEDQKPFFDMDIGKNVMLTADHDGVGTGILMDVSFYIPKSVTPGVYTVAFQVPDGECLNEEFEEVPVVMPTVTITVSATGSAGCAHRNTTKVDRKEPNCTEDGYGVGVYCNDCLTYVTGHEKLNATGHQYEVTTNTASCDQGGEVTYTCAVCGSNYTDPLGALGHSFTNYVSNNDATCTEDGTEKAKCDRCDASFTRTAEGSALGHTEVVKPGYAATCTEEGLTDGKYCSVCNEVLVVQEKVPAGTHSFSEWEITKAPTCTEQGQQSRSCTACDETETDTIEMLPHGVAVLEAVAPGCTTSGLTEGVCCPGCQLVLTAQEEIPAVGHSFGDWTVKTQPTTEAEGEQIRTCATCGEEESRAIAKLDGNVIVVIINRFMNDTKLLLVVAAVVLCAAGVIVVVALKKKNS